MTTITTPGAAQLKELLPLCSVRHMTPGAPGVWYLGRNFLGWSGSSLGNPFIMGRDGTRHEVIEKYRLRLRAIIERSEQGDTLTKQEEKIMKELKAIAHRLKENGFRRQILLGCWCSPLPCHVEVVRDAVIRILLPGRPV